MPEKPQPDPVREIAKYWHISIQFVITVLALTLAGYWLDGKFETAPWLLLAGLGLGFSVGFYNLYREASGEKRR